jgi:hypothetical protein
MGERARNSTFAESRTVTEYSSVRLLFLPLIGEAMQAVLVELEKEFGRLRQGYDVWDARGRLVLRTLVMKRVLRRKAAYFRVNSTGKIYALESRFKSVEVPAGSIAWTAGARKSA